MYLTRIIFEIHFLSSKSTLEANKCEERAVAWKWPALLVTSPHGVTLWTKKHWRLALLVFASVFEVAVNFFHENWFLYKGRNDITIYFLSLFISVYLGVFLLLEPYNGKTKKMLGDRAFAMAAPRLFNSLPREIRHETCFNTFQTKVKTFFVSHCFLIILPNLIAHYLIF